VLASPVKGINFMPQPFNVQETIKRAEAEYGLGKGEYFKVQEGANKIRLLSPCVGYQGSYQGKPNFKFVCWIIDRKDENKIKLYFMPQTVLDLIGGLQMSDDFGFNEVPMPYDITIMAKGAGTKEVQYSVVPSPQRIPLTAAEQAAIDEKPTIDEVIEKLKEKQSHDPSLQQEQNQSPVQPEASPARAAMQRGMEKAAQSSNDEVNVEDIPF
jgi:hypothetical protein